MFSEITTALAGLKTFADLTTLVMKAKVDAALKEKASESNSVLISVQHTMIAMQVEYQTLLQDKDRLEKRLVEMENWEAEAANYELKEVAPGTFVYAFKSDEDPSTPVHWLCTNCYQNKRKSIFQRGTGMRPGGYPHNCPACSNVIYIPR